MNAARLASGILGVAAVAAAFALAFGLFAPVPSVAGLLDAADGGRYLLGLAAALLAAGLWFARRRGSSTTERFTKLRESPPEGVAAPTSTRVGGDFDRLVAERVRSDGNDPMRPVAARLRETAVGLYVDAADADAGTARRRVADGAWTDDRLAAAFLAVDAAGRMPLRSRLRAWFDPARERRRRVDAAADALFDLRDGVLPEPGDSEGVEGRSDDDRGTGTDASDATDDAREESWVARVTDGGRGARR